MDGLANLLFPQAPSYAQGLLGQEEAQKLQQQAQRSGLLNIGLGLLAAGAPSAVRTGTGAGLVQGLMAGQQAYQNVYAQRLQEMEVMRKLQEQQRQQQMQQAMQQLAPQALSGNQEALAQLAQILPAEQLAKFTTAAKTAQEMRTPAKTEYKEFNGILYEMKPNERPVPISSPAGKLTGDFGNYAKGLFGTDVVAELPAGAFDSINKAIIQQKEAGRTVIDMTGGQKGFENTSKLRNEFQGLPEYKAFNEMRSAYSQVLDGLNKSNPIGDVAAATKIMKLLDPGSVVRESELAIAMQATGLMDRVMDYANKVVAGTKLTDTQRKEFADLAKSLFGSSFESFQEVRDRYVDLANRYQFDPDAVVGKMPSIPQPKASGTDLQRLAADELRRRRGQ